MCTVNIKIRKLKLIQNIACYSITSYSNKLKILCHGYKCVTSIIYDFINWLHGQIALILKYILYAVDYVIQHMSDLSS